MVRHKSLGNSWNFSPIGVFVANWLVIVSSVLLCVVMSLVRLPGMHLVGIGPNWLLIWVVAWSVNRTPLQGILAGLVLGLIQDGMTAFEPTHAFSLATVGFLTARLQKHRYIQEDFISVALITFGMAVVSETIMALQFSLQGDRYLLEIWTNQQQVVVASAILSSLWSPIVSYPLNRWWNYVKTLRQLT
ncbi:MAG: rod shape-determining protein MreD [Cyanobacteria bacterium]|nr:rod shape-determining protein MreD [Cyanobacteriota bacterium]MDW8200592.1 rod shape-determining protein MreD [Cyanobacteriota bacterium SKYGB_h_bin112]